MPTKMLRDKNWEAHFQALEIFKKLQGHCDVPTKGSQDHVLGRWLHKQRQRKKQGLLQPDRVARLEAVGIVWDPLASLWEARVAALEEFKKSHGHCDVPRHYAPDPELAVWLLVQRREKRAGKLKPERLARLERLGVTWIPHAAEWERSFAQLLEYQEKFGHCDVPGTDPQWAKLCGWLSHQRASQRRGKLSLERAKRLEALGVVWEPRGEQEAALFEKLEQFYAQEGHCNISETHPALGAVGAWLTAQRSAKRKGCLSPDKESRLTALGMVWEPHDALWAQKFEALKHFKEREGHCEVTAHYRSDLGLKQWLAKQRSDKRSGTLSLERQLLLDSLGVSWEPTKANSASGESPSVWDDMLRDLKAFACREGHCNVPAKYAPNLPLGRWLDRQRQLRKKGKLPTARIAELEALGIVWSPKEAAENKRFAALESFAKEAGHCNVPESHPEWSRLGAWLSKKRRDKKRGILRESEVARLDSLGIEWSPHEAAWGNKFAELCDFMRVHGHCEIPSSIPPLAALASWLNTQRVKNRNGTLAPMRYARLNALGISWNPTQEKSEQMLAALADFKQRQGHCNVPYDCLDNPSLGKWLAAQRSAKKEGTLSAQLAEQLDALGVLWNPRREGVIRLTDFHEKACVACGQPFVPTHGNSKHCSPACYMSASTTYEAGTECLLWAGGVDTSGRPHAHWGGKRRKAHIFAYELSRGVVPHGMVVRHLCNNARCCNPAHLILGTHAENMADKARSGIVAAENHPKALLTNAQAIAIYNQRGSGTAADVSARFGVPTHVTRQIWKGETYTRATGATREARGRPAGEANHASKCSNQTALKIYAEKAHTPKSAASVARKYGVSFTVVRRIWSGKSYSGVTGAPRSSRARRKTNRLCVACSAVITNATSRRKYCSWKCALDSQVRKGGLDECWLWTAKTRSTNYGQVTFCGKRAMAHIVAFDLAHPEMVEKRKSEGLTVSHICHNTLCCNPAHLALATMKDNASANRGREDISGESHRCAKLSVPIVRRIKELIAQGVANACIRKRIKEENGFEVTNTMVADIRRNRSWRTVSLE